MIDEKISNLNRILLIEICKESKFTSKQKVVLILCWGIYFTVVPSQNISNGIKLIEFINNRDESFFDNLIKEIRNTNENDKSSVKLLFKKFNKEFKINGIGYPYFTKLFFFFSNNNSLPIMDKWLTISFIYLTLIDDKINILDKKKITDSIYHKNPFIENKSFNVKRKKGEFYFSYVSYLNEISKKVEVNIGSLETFLFGWSLKNKSNSNSKDYPNPRLTYDEYLKRLFK